MANTPIQLQSIDDVLAQQVGTFTRLPKINAPSTTVVNRAQCVDPSADHLPKFGVQRVVFQWAEEVQGESGPNGELVYKPINDQFDLVRIYSTTTLAGILENSSHGTNLAAQNFEITFYGTGLNVLVDNDNGVRSIKAAVDGGALGSELFLTGSAILSNRNTPANQVLVAASGLTLGVHTVRLNCSSSNVRVYGYEAVCATSAIQLIPGSSYVGGQKLSKASLSTDPYNSNFASGTLNATYGGHVVVYQKPDGTIAKAVQSNAGGTLLSTAVNHSNESVIRTYTPREFGAGRSDDFSTLTTTYRASAFTLDDGTTTLTSNDVQMGTYGTTVEGILTNLLNDYIVFTFVGTGLDFVMASDGTGTRTFTISVDGGSTTSYAAPVAGVTVVKIVSGLPYGTHTVKLVENNAGNSSPPAISKMVVYGPSKPSIPTGAVELSDYYLTGSYVQQTTPGTGSTNAYSQGVLVKANSREVVYVGSGINITSADATFASGFRVNIVNPGEYGQLAFFGTGAELYVEGNSSGVTSQVYIDGVLYTGAATVAGASCTWTAGTSTLAWSAATTVIVSITGLSLGTHTIKVVKTSSSAGTMLLDAIGIITPIHSPRPNGNAPGDYQSTQSVGSCSLGDSRKLPPQTVKALSNWSQAFGVALTPTSTSTSPVPIPDMICIVKTNGNPLEISYNLSAGTGATTGTLQFQVYVDGIAVGRIKDLNVNSSTQTLDFQASDNIIVPVSAGTHVIQLYWTSNTGSQIATNQSYRNLKAREIN